MEKHIVKSGEKSNQNSNRNEECKILSFDEFVEAVKEKLYCDMGENVRIDVHDTVKNNEVTYKALSLLKGDSNISPNIHLGTFYEDYLECKDLDQIVDAMKLIFEHHAGRCIDIENFMDFDKAKENIMIKIVTYEKNKQRLKHIPHVRFLDLAIVYYYYMESCEFDAGNGSIQIENEHLKMWGIDEKTLHKIAMKNSNEKMPMKFQSIYDIIVEMMKSKGIDTEEFLSDAFMMQGEVPMYVLSNEKNYFGASALYYPEVLKTISDRFQSDLIILPSSIHEVIILPVTGNERYTEINSMIDEINTDQVAEEEVLSDHLYYYDRMKNNLVIPSVTL